MIAGLLQEPVTQSSQPAALPDNDNPAPRRSLTSSIRRCQEPSWGKLCPQDWSFRSFLPCYLEPGEGFVILILPLSLPLLNQVVNFSLGLHLSIHALLGHTTSLIAILTYSTVACTCKEYQLQWIRHANRYLPWQTSSQYW